MFGNRDRLSKTAFALALASMLLTVPLSAALAAGPTVAGQPNQSCEGAGVRPGGSMTAPGSAFNPDGVSGGVYAGNQQNNTINEHNVSQYDVACFQLSIH